MELNMFERLSRPKTFSEGLILTIPWLIQEFGLGLGAVINWATGHRLDYFVDFTIAGIFGSLSALVAAILMVPYMIVMFVVLILVTTWEKLFG